MADIALDKVKEQCLELVLNIVPFSQVIFIFFMAIVLQGLAIGVAASPLHTLQGLGFRGLMGLDKGVFWDIGSLTLGSCFFLALVNAVIFKVIIRRSFRSSKISDRLSAWMQAGTDALKNLGPDDKNPIRDSVRLELEKRIRKYSAKRMLCETLASVALISIYGSAYLIYLNLHHIDKLNFSAFEYTVSAVAIWLSVLVHRQSVRYALAKIIPLQVYLSAVSGEIAFFIDTD